MDEYSFYDPESKVTAIRLDQLRQQRDDLKAALSAVEKNIVWFEEDMNRKELAAYFKAHPEIEPLAIGDELASTSDFWTKVESDIPNARLIWKRGIWVNRLFGATVEIRNKQDDIESCSSTTISAQLASDMRRAYLQSIASDNSPSKT